MRTNRVLPLLLIMLALALPARGSDAPLKEFFGTYEGLSVFPSTEVDRRELRVQIRPYAEAGFSVEWQTTIVKPGEDKRFRSQFLDLLPSADNPRVFVAAGSGGQSESGGSIVLDRRSYAWARILERTLTVNMLTVSEEGDYVMQTYNRTLTKKGDLALAFVRVRNGEVEQRIWGTLERVEP